MITWYALCLCKETCKYLRCKSNGSLGHLGPKSGNSREMDSTGFEKKAQVTYFHSFASRNTLNFKNYFWLLVHTNFWIPHYPMEYICGGFYLSHQKIPLMKRLLYWRWVSAIDSSPKDAFRPLLVHFWYCRLLHCFYF